MKRIAISCLLLAAIIAPFGGTQAPKVPDPPPVPGKFFTGAKPTPFPKLIEAIKSGRAGVYKASAPPPSILTVPKRLSMWGNSQYGCCVTSESVFSIADYSTFLGMDEIFVTESETISWARSHGYLNGAFLLEVMEDMAKDGIKDEKGVLRKAGKASTVDFSNEDTLKSAIAQGPVSIAIASSNLPSGAGNKSGWYVFGGRSNHSSDHCVCLHGYGPTSDLFKALNVAVPSNAPANGYLLYTWSTVGVVDHQWIMNTTDEAWVRNPTTTDLVPPPPPPPPPTTITVSVPNVAGAVNVPVKISPTASGGVSPYIFLFDYGDATQDAAGTHAYKTAGAYKVMVTAVDSRGQLGTATCVASIGTTPPPPQPPGPNGADTITWTINGVTQSFELFPIGTRKTGQIIFGPVAP